MADLLVPSLHRYLVRFQPKRIAHAFTDVLIIGSGIAGLRAALEVPAGLQQIVISKDQVALSNSGCVPEQGDWYGEETIRVTESADPAVPDTCSYLVTTSGQRLDEGE